MLKREKVSFIAQQPEDYCFASIFGFETPEWPSLPGHESVRPEEIKRAIQNIKDGKDIESKDHRVVQAEAMYRKLFYLPLRVKYPEAVNKSWPQFWRFLKDVRSLAGVNFIY